MLYRKAALPRFTVMDRNPDRILMFTIERLT